MQLVMTTLAVIAGLVFSIAISLLVEEFIFGQIFRLFFTAAKPSPARPVLIRLTSHQ